MLYGVFGNFIDCMVWFGIFFNIIEWLLIKFVLFGRIWSVVIFFVSVWVNSGFCGYIECLVYICVVIGLVILLLLEWDFVEGEG